MSAGSSALEPMRRFIIALDEGIAEHVGATVDEGLDADEHQIVAVIIVVEHRALDALRRDGADRRGGRILAEGPKRKGEGDRLAGDDSRRGQREAAHRGRPRKALEPVTARAVARAGELRPGPRRREKRRHEGEKIAVPHMLQAHREEEQHEQHTDRRQPDAATSTTPRNTRSHSSSLERCWKSMLFHSLSVDSANFISSRRSGRR